MNEECLICGARLEYLEKDETMECAICHRTARSKTRCVNGHYVCSECHTQGMDNIIKLCLEETSKNPIEIMDKLMDQPFCHMHGPEHHVMVGSALLTAYKNAGGDIELSGALLEMMNRGKSVRLLGSLWSGNQLRYVYFYHLEIHASSQGALCAVPSDDISRAWKDRGDWRSPML